MMFLFWSFVYCKDKVLYLDNKCGAARIEFLKGMGLVREMIKHFHYETHIDKPR